MFHHDASEADEDREFKVELAPSQPGTYEVYLPVPAQASGDPVPGFGLRVEAGAPQFGLVETEHGLALRVRADGPVRLTTDTHVPVRLSLDDATFAFRQFKFWAFLDRDAPGPVLLKLEVRQRHHAQDWERHLDTSGAIVVQEALEPQGWQVVKATQLFDIALGEGYGAGFPRIALGALATSLTAMYLPLGILAVSWVQKRRA